METGRLRFVPTDPDLRSADRSSSAGVMFLQVANKGLPASAYTNHHVTFIQHPYVQNFIPQTVATFGLLLHGEPGGTSARRVLNNVPHNVIQKVAGACALSTRRFVGVSSQGCRRGTDGGCRCSSVVG